MLSLPKGKRVLVVDDEPDTREMIAEELAACEVDTAGSYAEARAKLATGGYDCAVLDVMGVDGYALLEEFGSKVPCIMLTAHALAPTDLVRAMQGKAALFVPKEEIGSIEDYVAKVLLSADDPASLYPWLHRRFDFRRRFGPGWTPPPEDTDAPG